MNTNIILAIISVIFGILVIAFEGLLRWIVGIFFILLGIWLLMDYFGEKKGSPAESAPPPTMKESSAPEQK
jgi:multisubunit Na+/H+ antiporter MnhC subunit